MGQSGTGIFAAIVLPLARVTDAPTLHRSSTVSSTNRAVNLPVAFARRRRTLRIPSKRTTRRRRSRGANE